MQKSVLATLYHVESTDDDPNHSFCPTGPDSWCKYNVNDQTYTHKHGLPSAIKDEIEPIFVDLSDCSLLGKCLHGKTQNNNESLNSLVWRYCLKEIFVSRWAVTDAACFAVAIFNEGNNAFLELFKQLGLQTEHFTGKITKNSDFGRL